MHKITTNLTWNKTKCYEKSQHVVVHHNIRRVRPKSLRDLVSK